MVRWLGGWAACLLLAAACLKQLVNSPQKRRERLAGAGRRENERVLAALNRQPAKCLRRCRLTECFAKPGADGE